MPVERFSWTGALSALALLATLTPAGAQATPPPPDRSPTIVGGTPTTIERHPWQVALLVRDDDEPERFNCGASIVHSQWILTAAHCVARVVDGRMVIRSADRLTVGVGSTDRREGRRHLVAQLFVHEKYDRTAPMNTDDIALLKLHDRVDSRVVDLAPEDIKLTEGDTLELTGWGSTRLDAGGPLPTILQRIELPYITFETCNRPAAQGGQHGNITHDMLCVGATHGHGQCGGDSGGPLVRHTPSGPVQVGVVSFSSRPCTTQVGVFTRVSSYRDWIARIMAFN